MALINTTTTGVLGTTVYGDGAGSLTVQKDGVTQGIYGNIPTFGAYKSTNQSITTATWTKVIFEVEEFDTNNNFVSSTFTPTVAGYYSITVSLDVGAASTSMTAARAAIYKNGGQWRFLPGPYSITATSEFVTGGTALIYMNGTTDYLESYIWISGTSPVCYSGQSWTYFQGVLVKAT